MISRQKNRRVSQPQFDCAIPLCTQWRIVRDRFLREFLSLDRSLVEPDIKENKMDYVTFEGKNICLRSYFIV